MIGSFVVALAAVVAVAQSAFVVPPSSTKATNYQKWAHYHWVWLKNDLGNQANETALVQGYKDANIPVGALNIDSTWATQYNNFVVNTDKFPDFKELIDDLHNQGIKVTMWYVALS
jgi:alpha-glucosidase (family GH31 glycosyl hydrolase)